MSAAPNHVVVVGRDADLWLTATAICSALAPLGIKVTAIELPTRLGPASAYSTLPAIESLHARLGLDEAALLRTTRGSFSLGYNMLAPGRAPFFLAHGSYGAPIDGGDFFHFWLKARRFGLTAALEDFSPTAMAARHGRILLPDEDTGAFGRTDYAYHLPAIAYAALLKSQARRLGIAMLRAGAVAVERGADSGDVVSVRPDGGQPVAGDLFIDASGPDAVLLSGALGVAAEDWRTFFPFDRRLSAQGKPFSAVPGYADVRLAQSSWTALYASQAATHIVHAFRSSDGGDDAALSAATFASGRTLRDVTVTGVAPAIRSEAWSNNVVAIGSSAGIFDPLFDLDLHVIQLGIVHLLSLFPAGGNPDPERAEYNRIIRSHFERLRDFQATPYLLAAGVTAPDSLIHKVETFRARGAVSPMEDETFAPDQWRALFTGLGLAPESWPPAIDSTSPERVKESFRRILGFVRTKVLEQPSHGAYLADIGAGSA